MWSGDNTYPGKIQTIGIPTRCDSFIRMVSFMSMSVAGYLKNLQFLVCTNKELHVTTELCQFRPAWPMPGITVIILPAAIVKDGEQLDYSGISTCMSSKFQSVSMYTHPVRRSMWTAK
jgi:hypothetical protein